MKALHERIRAEAVYLGDGMIRVDSFLNHQVDAGLMAAVGKEFARRCSEAGVGGVSKVITAEVSGIAPALMAARVLDVPMVYARKQRPVTMTGDVYQARAPSRSKGGMVELMISTKYLGAADHVLLVDDFLATGSTLVALTEIVRQSGASLCGIGCVIERVFEHGRKRLNHLDVPVMALAQVDLAADRIVVS